MNKIFAYLFCVGLYPMQPLEQELKAYQSQFRKIPLLSSLTQTTQTANLYGQHLSVQQKFGFKKKRVEYTLAVRY